MLSNLTPASLRAFVCSLLLFGCSALAFAARSDLMASVPGVQSIDVDPAVLDLVVDLPGEQPVGTQRVVQVSFQGVVPPAGQGVENELFQFMVMDHLGQWRVARDFAPGTRFELTSLEEGMYAVAAVSFNTATKASYLAVESLPFLSRVTGGQAVVNATRHPLVALYSAPGCASGTVRIRFRRLFGGPTNTTPAKTCTPDRSLNFLVAGLAPDKIYVLETEWQTTLGTIISTPAYFVTPALPAALGANSSLLVPGDWNTSVNDGVILMSEGPTFSLVAKNLLNELIWYFDSNLAQHDLSGMTLTRPVAGGSTTVLLSESIDGLDIKGQTMREVDLLGNTVRETNVQRVNAQLLVRGLDLVGSFHHEALRLPNGYTAMLASVEHIVEDAQGPGPVDVVSDAVIVLDENLQLAWYWSAFDHLDINETAILGETCTSQAPGCPPLFLDTVANDWTHSNAIAYSPEDGNLLVSMRHLDAVFKLDYSDGQGSGDILWRLGSRGDFSLLANDVWPWFSHQHDVHYEGPLLVMFDNGNVRYSELGEDQHSRGQVYALDEAGLTAVQLRNFDLGAYSDALGSAQRLSNGNWHFNNGFINFGASNESIEVTPYGEQTWVMGGPGPVYRTFRLQSLYQP